MQTPLEEDIARNVLLSYLTVMGTGFFARVESFEASTCTATVTPFFQLQPAPTEGEPNPAAESLSLTGVPVVFPTGGGWSFRFELTQGDRVWVAVSQRSLDEIQAWFAGGGDAYLPASDRFFDLNDGVAYPVTFGASTVGSSLVIEGHDARIELESNGKIRLNDEAKAAAGVAFNHQTRAHR